MVKSRPVMLLRLLLVGCLVPILSGAESAYLTRVDPVLVEWSQNEEKYYRDDRVAPETAREIVTQFEARGTRESRSVHYIYDLPGDRLYLITGTGPESSAQFGLQYFLVRFEGSDLTILHETLLFVVGLAQRIQFSIERAQFSQSRP